MMTEADLRLLVIAFLAIIVIAAAACCWITGSQKGPK